MAKEKVPKKDMGKNVREAGGRVTGGEIRKLDGSNERIFGRGDAASDER
jgi:hypothetical protein